MIVKISELIPADVETIAKLARLTWQHAYRGIITQAQIDYMLEQRYNAPRLLAELDTPGLGWIKATLDGRLVGFAATLPGSAPEEMKLDKLYVDPAWQRLGIGARLLEHVAARALERGCTTLVLAVNKRNARAIAAYAKYGFVVGDSVRVDIGSGFFMDDFIMRKALTLSRPAGA